MVHFLGVLGVHKLGCLILGTGVRGIAGISELCIGSSDINKRCILSFVRFQF